MLSRRTTPAGLIYYVSPLLESAHVPHAFSTRLGGVSPPPFDSLNLGNPAGGVQDEQTHIQENYRLFQSAIGTSDRTRCWVHQVHGAVVHEVRPDRPFTSGPQGDALVSDDPACVLAIRVADCVPVLLASEDGTVVAAVHAGWRGVVAGVVPAALERLAVLTGRAPASMLAAVGPSISVDAFEVGPEVVAEFGRALGSDAPVRPGRTGKHHIDLAAAVRIQLLRGGLPANHIDLCDRCTSRDRDEFFSHRRDGPNAGRMAALIAPA